VTSAADGVYRLSTAALPCTLEVMLVGYRPGRAIVAASRTGRELPLDISLTPLAIPLGEIRVQADAPGKGAALTRDQILLIPGTGDDVIRAIQILPGAVAPELSSSFLLRGGESDETLVRYDGIDLLEPYHIREWGGSFSAVGVETSERIRLQRGGLPAQYGRHLSGILEVDPPAGRTEAPRVDLGIGLTQARAAALVPVGAGSLLLAGREGLFAAVARSVRFDPNANVIPKFRDVLINGRWPAGSNQTFHLLALGMDDDLQYYDRFPANGVNSEVRNATLGVRWTNRPSSGAHHEAVASGDYFDRRARHGRTGAADDRTRALRTRWESRLPLGGTMSVAGGVLFEYEEAFLRFDSIEGRIADGVYRERIESTLRGTATRRRAESHLSLERRWGNRFSTVVGLNVSRDDYGWGVRRDSLPAESEQGGNYLAPRASVVFRPSSPLRLRVAGGWLAQPTFLNQLTEERVRTRLGRTRDAREIALGLEWSPSAAFVRVEGYLREDRGVGFPAQDLTSRVPLDEPLDRGDSRGLEIFCRAPLSRHVDVSISYAWSRATWRTVQGSVPRSFDQPHAVTALGTIHPGRGWDATATVRFHTGNAYTRGTWTSPDGRYDWDLSYGPLMGERYSDFFRFDLRVHRALHWGREASFYIEMLNVTGHPNPYVFTWGFDRVASGGSVPHYYFLDLVPRIPLAGIEVRF
jgi:hypothetical protein